MAIAIQQCTFFFFFTEQHTIVHTGQFLPTMSGAWAISRHFTWWWWNSNNEFPKTKHILNKWIQPKNATGWYFNKSNFAFLMSYSDRVPYNESFQQLSKIQQCSFFILSPFLLLLSTVFYFVWNSLFCLQYSNTK